MRSFILLTTIIGILLFSVGCKTADIDPFNKLYGIWQWVYSSGGFGGDVITPASEGYTKSLCFDKKGNFLMLKNHRITSSGQYSIVRKVSMLYNQTYDAITFDSSEGWGITWLIISLDSKQMKLSDDYYDGWSHTYKK